MSKQSEQHAAGAQSPADVDALVRRAQRGDMEAFEAVVKAFETPMYSLAYRMAGNHDDACDMAQEIFIKLHRTIRQFRWRSKFSTWLYTLALNTCRSARRKLGRVGSHELRVLDCPDEPGRRPMHEPADAGPGPVDGLERAEVREQVDAAIGALPPDFRAVLVLREIEGLAYEEIAEAMGCSVGTVKSRLARARLRARDLLKQQGLLCAAIGP